MIAAAAGEIPFSHKRHAALKLRCVACHPAARKAERAGLPSVAECLSCHRAVLADRPLIRRLAGQPANATPFASAGRVRQADFVFFSHARHTARVECDICHTGASGQESGPIAAPLTMKACMDCHAATRATLACNACHELGQ
ncbi:MAG TPA: cytochrome c3 family protein [Bryobacteraceae bacterium]|nr:cytochrome c3 family protein [Bryobacteraceae bacterium]